MDDHRSSVPGIGPKVRLGDGYEDILLDNFPLHPYECNHLGSFSEGARDILGYDVPSGFFWGSPVELSSEYIKRLADEFVERNPTIDRLEFRVDPLLGNYVRIHQTEDTNE
jgi:hypothetical protein